MKPYPVDANNVDGYISAFPEHTQTLLQQLREIIRTTAPNAEEVISYKMPGYRYKGALVYFAGYKKHIGFYPMPSALNVFVKDVAGYKTAKGSVQFPLDKPLPVKLIEEMVKFRLKENDAKAKVKVKAAAKSKTTNGN